MGAAFPYLVRSGWIVLRGMAKEKEAPAVEGSTPLTKKRSALRRQGSRKPTGRLQSSNLRVKGQACRTTRVSDVEIQHDSLHPRRTGHEDFPHPALASSAVTGMDGSSRPPSRIVKAKQAAIKPMQPPVKKAY